MAIPHQPLPLNHPPPQPASQPPQKKLRSRYARPKLTIEQVTDHEVIQSALRIGRRARANAPKPGEEPQALNKLLNHMAGWAHQVAPYYSLAEFVVAAQGIAGNRELRPMLGVFRLAELRDVTGDDGTDPKKNHDDREKDIDKQEKVVQPDTGPIHADVGPVEADVGPDCDEWDELEIVPDEAVEIRPVPKTAPSDSEKDPKLNDALSLEVEARIEQNRLAAIARRKVTMARLKTENGTSPTDNIAKAPEDDLTGDARGPSPSISETAKQATEAQTDDQLKPKQFNSKGERQSSEPPHSKHASSEKGNEGGNDVCGKLKPVDENHIKRLPRVLSEGEEAKLRSKENETSTGKGDKEMEKRASPPTISPKRTPKTTDGLKKPEVQKDQVNDDSCQTEQDKDTCKDKTKVSNLTERIDSTGASNNEKDEDVDMAIMAEFEAADEG